MDQLTDAADCDPYCEVELNQEGERADRVFRTPVRSGTLQPEWGFGADTLIDHDLQQQIH